MYNISYELEEWGGNLLEWIVGISIKYNTKFHPNSPVIKVNFILK